MPHLDLIYKAQQLIQAGELVAIPTETVYGLAADAHQPAAIEKIFKLKQRPLNNPLIVHLADVNELSYWAIDIPPAAYTLAETFWPGPLTMVLPKAGHVHPLLTANQATIALRMPAHPFTLELLKTLGPGAGLAAPSANRFTQLSPTCSEHVRQSFGANTPFILEGGPCRFGIESTILDLTQPKPQILRPGSIGPEDLSDCLKIDIDYSYENTQRVRVPGMHHQHYSPQTLTYLISSAELEKVVEDLKKTNSQFKIVWLTYSQFNPRSLPHVNMPSQPRDYAAQLYAQLHELDQQSFDVILIEKPPEDLNWFAIQNRLMRAAKPYFWAAQKS